MSIETTCPHCGEEFDMRHGRCPACLHRSKMEFVRLVEGFPTYIGQAQLAWECFKRLTPKQQEGVLRAMEYGEAEDDDVDERDDSDWVESIAITAESGS